MSILIIGVSLYISTAMLDLTETHEPHPLQVESSAFGIGALYFEFSMLQGRPLLEPHAANWDQHATLLCKCYGLNIVNKYFWAAR